MLGFEGDDAREKVIVLLTMCFALAMAMLDNTVVNVALPTLSRELGSSVSDLQWIVDGYVLAFASLLLTGGILGDRYGRKRMFLTGLAIFTGASLACGLSQSSSELIAFRAVQGIGAALLMPGTLSILTVTFPPKERARAIGLWAGVSGIACRVAGSSAQAPYVLPCTCTPPRSGRTAGRAAGAVGAPRSVPNSSVADPPLRKR